MSLAAFCLACCWLWEYPGVLLGFLIGHMTCCLMVKKELSSDPQCPQTPSTQTPTNNCLWHSKQIERDLQKNQHMQQSLNFMMLPNCTKTQHDWNIHWFKKTKKMLCIAKPHKTLSLQSHTPTPYLTTLAVVVTHWSNSNIKTGHHCIQHVDMNLPIFFRAIWNQVPTASRLGTATTSPSASPFFSSSSFWWSSSSWKWFLTSKVIN